MMLENQSIAAYLQQLAARTSTPGGGAAAGVCGAQAAALLGMVAQFSKQQPTLMQAVIMHCDNSARAFLNMAEADVAGFKAVMAAYGLPTVDGASKEHKQLALQEALRAAVAAPLAMIDETIKMIPLAQQLVQFGNKNLVTDVGIAASLMQSCLQSSQLNVRVNLRSIQDLELTEHCQAQLHRVQQGAMTCQQLLADIDASLK
jgi:formiminotetrahydrofolate cyclodeaminase